MSGTRTDIRPFSSLTDEECEANLSALVDGQLEETLLLPTIDHLLRSKRCQRFFRDARSLQEFLSEKRDGHLLQEKPAKTWERIEHASGLRKSRTTRLFSRNSPLWAAAAAFILVIGLWTGGYKKLVQPLAPGSTITIRLAEDQGSMDEKRFVELTAELLRADRRYQRKMLEIMETVNSGDFIREGSAGDLTEEARPFLASASMSDQASGRISGNSANAMQYW